MRVEAKGYSFPPIKGKYGIVVRTTQGQNPVGNEDSELVPVGVGNLQEGGSPSLPALAQRVQGAPGGDDAAYRTRVYFLPDISASMQGKLHIVRDKIQTLTAGLAAQGIKKMELVLIPYDDRASIELKTQDPQELVREVAKLYPRGGTNFTVALRCMLDDIKRDQNNEARNLAILVTDGEHNPGKGDQSLLEASRDLIKSDCAAYLVGVGNGYDEALLKEMLENIRFGGLTHIPHKNEVFRDVLPRFLAAMRAAPQYPVISFTGEPGFEFEKVVNMKPSVRRVIEEQFSLQLAQLIPSAKHVSSRHYPGVVGYQLESDIVGFTRNPDKAKIYLLVYEQGNGKKPTSIEEVEIIPFDQAILDPRDRDLIQKAWIGAEKVEAVGARNVAVLKEFRTDYEKYLSQEELDMIDREIKNLENPHRGIQEEGDTRFLYSEFATEYTQLSFGTGGGTVNDPSQQPGPKVEQVNALSQVVLHLPDSDIEPLSRPPSVNPAEFSGLLGPLEDLNRPIGELPNIAGAPLDPAVYNVPPLPPITVSLTKISGGAGGSIIFLKEEVRTVGRSPISDLPIIDTNDNSASRRHFKISRRGNSLYLENLSINGTYLNGVSITQETELKSGDEILAGNTVFRVTISSN